MRVRDVMTAAVRTCRPESNLAEAVEQMWEADCGVLPVIGADSRIVGVITDRDICVAVATKGRTADRIAVREVSSERVVHTCLATDDAADVLKTMQTYKVRRLPVIDEQGHLEGIVSLNDIVTHPGAATSTSIVSALASICERRAPKAASTAA